MERCVLRRRDAHRENFRSTRYFGFILSGGWDALITSGGERGGARKDGFPWGVKKRREISLPGWTSCVCFEEEEKGGFVRDPFRCGRDRVGRRETIVEEKTTVKKGNK